jgi:hypothetical protein
VWFLFAFPLQPGMVSVFSCVFLGIWTSSFEKVLFNSLAHFFIGLLILGKFGLLILGKFSFLSSLYILVISPFSDV